MHTTAHLKRSRVGAFTLIELLVSMVVLTLLVLLTSQLVGSAAATINRSGKHMDSDTEARLLFNRVAVDLGAMVKRGDVDYSSFKQPAGALGTQYNSTTISANPQGGNPANDSSGAQAANDELAFYSETDGYFSGSDAPTGKQKAQVSLVAYMVDNDPVTKLPSMRRLGKGLGWDPNGNDWGTVTLLPLTLTGTLGQWTDLFNSAQNSQTVDPDYQTVGSQVVRFEYTYLLKPNFNDPSGTVYPSKLSLTPYWSTTNSMMSSKGTLHTSISGFKDVAAIVVAIAILDTTSRATVSSASYATLTAALPDAVEGTDIAPAWTTAINAIGSPTFATKAVIPQAAASGIRVYERFFYLNTATP